MTSELLAVSPPSLEPLLGRIRRSLSGPRARVVVVVSAMLSLALVVRLTGLDSYLSVARLRSGIATLGFAGPAIFLGIYVAAVTLQLPHPPLVAAAVLAYGPFPGLVLSYLCTLTYDLGTFHLMRRAFRRARRSRHETSSLLSRIRGTVLWRQLERRPLTVVTAARTVMNTALPLTFAFATGPVTARQHAMGTAVGVLPQLLATVALAKWAFGAHVGPG